MEITKKGNEIKCAKGCNRNGEIPYQGKYYCKECYEKILDALDREKEAEYECEEEDMEL